ncbi:hypothetical protein OGAPHI_002448 [Ogataea philodendri]|uniref:RNA polymerase II-associated protein RBA50 n=1 Tax=Ogataea philodendri TaxID=1378263 RepID=A0A9P8PC04_9ASCO|nr:uncharacterized protein OGAPHI_002448 [Ogataea philodendri]KAH3668694.1 hypothetical protein OGAPHI_002448 [Ogataea philodendri]
MDLLGDIVEHDTSDQVSAPVAFVPRPATGFPLASKRKPAQRLAKKPVDKPADTHLSEKEQIHLENVEKLSRMSPEERMQAKEELVSTLDPKILQMLLNKARPQDLDQGRPAVDSEPGSAVSSPQLKPALRKNSASSSSSDKKVRFNNEASVKYVKPSSPLAMPVSSSSEPHEDEDWEDIEYLDDSGPSFEEAQRLKQASVHFPKPSTLEKLEKLDLNDPDFNDKLHAKFFPDLPKDPKQLEWMKAAPETPNEIAYDTIADLRFDLNGDLVTSENLDKLASARELHHHSAHPELPGYTLAELAHYLRSSFAGQRCIALRSLGRILYKLGEAKFQVVDQQDEEQELAEFERKCWGLVIDLNIMDLINEFASDKQRNLSVKNYAIEALYLWKKGRGDVKLKKVLQERLNSSGR